MNQIIQLLNECGATTRALGFLHTETVGTAVSGFLTFAVTIDMADRTQIVGGHSTTAFDDKAEVVGRSISDVVKDREANPKRAAALARARGRLAAQIESAGTSECSLAALRLKKGMSQAMLAERMGVQQSYIARVESGSDDLKYSTIQRLAKALECSTSDVVEAIDHVRQARGVINA